MEILRRSTDKYGIQKVGKNKHRIVKILAEYESEEQALQDLTRLMTGELSEQDILNASKE